EAGDEAGDTQAVALLLRNRGVAVRLSDGSPVGLRRGCLVALRRRRLLLRIGGVVLLGGHAVPVRVRCRRRPTFRRSVVTDGVVRKGTLHATSRRNPLRTHLPQ